jgi:hypothetical protein
MINIRPNQILRLVSKESEACWFQIPARGGWLRWNLFFCCR